MSKLGNAALDPKKEEKKNKEKRTEIALGTP